MWCKALAQTTTLTIATFHVGLIKIGKRFPSPLIEIESKIFQTHATNVNNQHHVALRSVAAAASGSSRRRGAGSATVAPPGERN